jgi:hypothetical protein
MHQAQLAIRGELILLTPSEPHHCGFAIDMHEKFLKKGTFQLLSFFSFQLTPMLPCPPTPPSTLIFAQNRSACKLSNVRCVVDLCVRVCGVFLQQL